MSEYFKRKPIFSKTISSEDVRAGFAKLLADKKGVALIGVTQAIEAIIIERQAKIRQIPVALYLSGAGLSTSLGIPDIGVMDLEDVVYAVKTISRVTNLPLLVDIDTGYEDIEHTIKEIEAAGAAGVHVEDQLFPKRCGHLDGKELVTKKEMIAKIKKAVDAKTDKNFIIMARSDAKAVEGFDAMIDRLDAYIESGADAIFPEAMTGIEDFTRVAETFNVPMLANLTENGKTPLGLEDILKRLGYSLLLYPVTYMRAHMKSLGHATDILLNEGNKNLAKMVMARQDAMQLLNYDQYVSQDEKLGNHGYEA